VQLSGPLASKSTLSEFWLMRCRASEPRKKRLDGIDQVIPKLASELGVCGDAHEQPDGCRRRGFG
jgi:hypothetical protein